MPAPESPPPDGAAPAAAAGLTWVCDASPGFRRLRARGGFRYVDAEGRPLRDASVLDRIRRLAIPPAYAQVWICPDPRGHLQATARDARGRKQYRYHPQWRAARDHGKFERLLEFGAALPKLRRRLARDLALPGLPRAKVLAVLVALLDHTRSRIGNAEYARDNGSYGLTTLENRHVEFDADGSARMSFRGKSGQQQEVDVRDPRLARIMRHCQELPGQALFQYVDGEGQSQRVDSGMVNAYLREAMGVEFTAKDFRTFGGTVRAVQYLSRNPGASMNEVVAAVAHELGNTPAVARKSYIHPAVLEAWRSGELHAARGKRRRGLSAAEALTLELLRTRSVRSLDEAQPDPGQPGRGSRIPLRSIGATGGRKPARVRVPSVAPLRASPPSTTRAPAAGG